MEKKLDAMRDLNQTIGQWLACFREGESKGEPFKVEGLEGVLLHDLEVMAKAMAVLNQ
jgi:hypothetical protein